MKFGLNRILLAAFIIFGWAIGPSDASTMRQRPAPTNAGDRVLVRWRTAPPAPTTVPGRTLRAFPRANTTVIQTPPGSTVDRTLAALRADPRVLYAGKNVRRRLLSLDAPNEPTWNATDPQPDYITRSFNIDVPVQNRQKFMWALMKVRAHEAWSVYPGAYYTAADRPTGTAKVAVLDTGMDLAHPDWRNTGASGPDVSQGGQILVGNAVSFLNGATTPLPNDDDWVGHGTHTAGIIGAAANNGGSVNPREGAIGLAYQARIMPIQVLDSAEEGYVEDIISGIYYAVDNGAQIISISLGDYDYSPFEQDAVDYAWRNNVLVVAAAGNDGDKQNRITYPAACNHVLAVAGTDINDVLAPYSNRGTYVGISAPAGYVHMVGVDFEGLLEFPTEFSVWSTTPTHPFDLQVQPDGLGGEIDDYMTERYAYAPGTSVAAPFVAALAALYADKNGFTRATPNAPALMIQAIQRGATPVVATAGGGWDRGSGYGRIDALNTLLDVDARSATVGSIVGQVTSHGAAQNGVRVSAVKDGETASAVTRFDGGFRLANLSPGTWTVSVTVAGNPTASTFVAVLPGVDNFGADFAFPIVSWGDVVQDGVVDVRDAVGAMRMLAGTDPLSLEKLERADVHPWAGTGGRAHGDGHFTVDDVRTILRLAGGLTP